MYRVVEYATYDDMKNAMRKLDGAELNGRRLKLTEDYRGRKRRLVIFLCTLIMCWLLGFMASLFMKVFAFPVALGQGLALVEGAGVALVDVIAPVPGPGDVLAPGPGLAIVPVLSLRIVPIPRIGIDLVPIPESATKKRASLAAVADQGLLIVLVPDLDLDLAPARAVGHTREKETIRITLTNQKRMVPMTGGHIQGPLLPERAPRRMRICDLAVLPRQRMMVLMSDGHRTQLIQ